MFLLLILFHLKTHVLRYIIDKPTRYIHNSTWNTKPSVESMEELLGITLKHLNFPRALPAISTTVHIRNISRIKDPVPKTNVVIKLLPSKNCFLWKNVGCSTVMDTSCIDHDRWYHCRNINYMCAVVRSTRIKVFKVSKIDESIQGFTVTTYLLTEMEEAT